MSPRLLRAAWVTPCISTLRSSSASLTCHLSPPRPAFPRRVPAQPSLSLASAPTMTSEIKGNRATSGARFSRDLPRGDAPLQLYSMFTPNGNKVTILLEELGLAYDSFCVNIIDGDNFSTGFVELNPNEKIPVLLDVAGPDGKEFSVMESGAIMMYLCEKCAPDSPLLPTDPAARSKVLQWLMWQMGSGPYFGQFGHFYKYYSEKLDYPISRYTTEAKRMLDVLDKQLGRETYVAGPEYSIADIAIYPWIRCLDRFYGASETLELDKYENVNRWLAVLGERTAVQLGMNINNPSDDELRNYSSKGKQ